jgi:hypothetical protein
VRGKNFGEIPLILALFWHLSSDILNQLQGQYRTERKNLSGGEDFLKK